MAKIKSGEVVNNVPESQGGFVEFTFPADGTYVIVPVLLPSMYKDDGTVVTHRTAKQFDYTSGEWNDNGRSVMLAYVVSMPENVPDKRKEQLDFVGQVAPIVTAHGVVRDVMTAITNEEARFFEKGNKVFLPNGKPFEPDDADVDEFDGFTAEWLMLEEDGSVAEPDGTCLAIIRTTEGKRTTYTIGSPSTKDMKTAKGLMSDVSVVNPFEMTLDDVVSEHNAMLDRIAESRNGSSDDTSIL